MLAHNSPAMERFAAYAHFVWALVSVIQGMFAAAAGVMIYPLARFSGQTGFYFVGVEFCLVTICLFSIFAALFHIWGARDHLENLRKLETNG